MLGALLGASLAFSPGGLRAVVPRHHSSPRCGAVVALDDSPPEPFTDPEQAVPLDEQWVGLAMRERYPILRDISASIRTRRTVEESELALKLEAEFRADPTLFEDIDFAALIARIDSDARAENVARITTVLSEEDLLALRTRWEQARAELAVLLPIYSNLTSDEEAGVAATLLKDTRPKVRRMIAKARELPLTVEVPIQELDDLDLGGIMQESKNVAAGIKSVWRRLNGVGSKEDELVALQREAKALLGLRAEATKLRAGIRLVQRQKELKASFLVRSDGDSFLEQTLMADVSIMRLERELSLKVAYLEMERIFITLESELLASSTLVDQLLAVVEEYATMEASLRNMVSLVMEQRHSAITDEELGGLEASIGDLLLKLGLQTPEQEPLSWSRTRETWAVNTDKAMQGVRFYGRGVQLIAQDVQLAGNMLGRAVLQGYTLRAREVKLLRRILKDLVTLVPFVIILIIPLSPLGHVLVFSFIQRFFPDFLPSAFTESRQQIMSMYSSITTPGGTGTGASLGDMFEGAGAAVEAEGGAVQCNLVEEEGVPTVQCEEPPAAGAERS
jgi:hypothetical protein